MPKKSIGNATRAQIKGYLEGFIEHVVRDYRGRPIPTVDAASAYLAQSSSQGRLKPFHAAIIPPELMRVSAFERGFSTALGTTFEECARLIALEHHADAQRGYALAGEVSLSALGEIESQVARLDEAAARGESPPALADMIQRVLDARQDGDLERRGTRVDLYVLTKDGTRLFFEMKSPQPNKGQCLEVTQRIENTPLAGQTQAWGAGVLRDGLQPLWPQPRRIPLVIRPHVHALRRCGAHRA